MFSLSNDILSTEYNYSAGNVGCVKPYTSLITKTLSLSPFLKNYWLVLLMHSTIIMDNAIIEKKEKNNAFLSCYTLLFFQLQILSNDGSSKDLFMFPKWLKLLQI